MENNNPPGLNQQNKMLSKKKSCSEAEFNYNTFKQQITDAEYKACLILIKSLHVEMKFQS